MHGKNKRGNKK